MNSDTFLSIVKPYTMTSQERILALYDALEHVRNNGIQGDFVECGVWRGGNILGILEYLNFHNIRNVNVWLYDTFEGMTEPDENDIDIYNRKAKDILNITDVKAACPLEYVKQLLSSSSFPMENIKYVKGDVMDTLNNADNLPKSISLLRLDTDFYKSTKKEMDVLYPLLQQNGVLIVDDFGHWAGSKQAIKEYFSSVNKNPYIQQIDYTGIKIIKENI